MGQSPSKVMKVYDALAEEYAETFAGEHEKKPKDLEMLRRFSQEVGARMPVWDFGCGPGHTAEYLHSLGVEISGLDLSENILEQARDYHPGINFQKGNILDLEFESDSIAAVVSFYAIVHFTKEQAESAFREIYRVLQPGGLYFFTYHIGEETIQLDEFLGKKIDVEFMFFATDFIVSTLEAIGFATIEVVEREPYPDVEYQSRRAYAFAVKPGARKSS